ncbi:MAG: hypothetical protein AAGJ87_15290 [Pseudomonadota bacterium]
MTAANDQRPEFEARGVIKVPGLISNADARGARDLICDLAAEHAVYSSTGWSRSESRFGIDKSFRAAMNALNHAADFPDLISKSIVDMAETLIGEPVSIMPPGQQILFTLPGAAAWFVPHDVWHVDMPRLGALGAPGVQIFVILKDLEPKGGGTLVLAGSHRFLNTSRVIRSKKIKQLLGKEPYFRALFDGGRAPVTDLNETVAAVDGVDLEVVELTGDAGDVYVMDLRALHTLAPNARDTARIMLTCRLPRAAIADQWQIAETRE